MLPSITFREQYVKLSRFTIVTGNHGVGKTGLLEKIENTKAVFPSVHNIPEKQRSKLILESMQYLFPILITNHYPIIRCTMIVVCSIYPSSRKTPAFMPGI